MSYESTVTVAGHLGSEPRFFLGEGDSPDFVSFRMATTRSYFNKSTQTWVDGETTWFTVKAWRNLAKNIKESLAKGDAVVVHGSLDTQKWVTSDGATRESLVLDAQYVGPNLARGTAKFRPMRSSASNAEGTSRTEETREFATLTSSSREIQDLVDRMEPTAEGGYYVDDELVDSNESESTLSSLAV